MLLQEQSGDNCWNHQLAGRAGELLSGVSVIIHFLFHVDFGATSGTESKTGFWSEGLCFLNSSPVPAVPQECLNREGQRGFL